MIRMNYINAYIVKERKSGVLGIRIIKILTLFAHLLIIFFVVGFFNIKNKIIDYNNKIFEIKQVIEEKRASFGIEDKEKVWNEYYYKLLAVKEILRSKTKYSLAIIDLGVYFPKDSTILSLSCGEDSLKVSFFVKQDIIKTLNSFYDYANILKIAFEKSTYIKKDDILIENVQNADNFKNLKNKDLKNKSGYVYDVKLSVLARG